jgi:hypothetical protein
MHIEPIIGELILQQPTVPELVLVLVLVLVLAPLVLELVLVLELELVWPPVPVVVDDPCVDPPVLPPPPPQAPAMARLSKSRGKPRMNRRIAPPRSGKGAPVIGKHPRLIVSRSWPSWKASRSLGQGRDE